MTDTLIATIPQVDGSTREIHAQDATHAARARAIVRDDPPMVDRLNGIEGIEIRVLDRPQSKTRTITLTGRPPVKIREDAWPVLAEASYHDYDGQYDFQSFRHWRGSLRVRRHEDGRALVYATCSYQTAHHDERGYGQKAGELLEAGATTEQIIEAIRRVHQSIDIIDEEHSDMWRLLADQCIADLPAEEL